MNDRSNTPAGPTRREFVVLTTAAAVGLAAKLSAAETAVMVPGTQQGAMPILSVGYWKGTPDSEVNGAPGSGILTAGPGTGDDVYAQQAADIRVVGFWRAPRNRSMPVSVTLLPLYPATDPATGGKAPTINWNLTLNADGVVAGPLRSRFIVPLDAEQRVEVAIQKTSPVASRRRVASPDPSGASELRSIRAAASDPSSILQFGVLNSRIALRSGTYFVALRGDGSEDAPVWSLLRARNFRVTDRLDPAGEGILTTLSGVPLSFDYMVLVVSPAQAAAA